MFALRFLRALSGHSHDAGGAHTHSHSHSHSHGEAGGEENVHLYEQQPLAADISERVPKAMLKAYHFDADTTTVMDFACGTGLIARGLVPHCKSIVGVEINPAMVNYFGEKIHSQGQSCVPPEKMRVVCANLKGEDSELDGEKFDVIVCSAAYHHFESITDITSTLCFFLKPGGCLLVADFTKSAGPVPEAVPNAGGFTEHDIQRAFADAGLQEFSIEQITTVKFQGQNFSLFLAKGTKPEL
ncbi:S-adenosyl-L-methionine-dependent methyltransferase [Mycena polygramma]|nr:S-adenosyl-L-methionine-dependent methyltransferase [Mycena polygramma]